MSLAIIRAIAKPITDLIIKRQERKHNEVVAKAKITQAKVNGEREVTLTDAQWEALSIDGKNNTWKDEYITIVITSPILGILIGSVWLALTNDNRLLNGFKEGIKALNEIGVDMGLLMTAVVFAAVGLKLWRR